MFNPVAPYRYLLPTIYWFMTNIANSDLFVCGCQTCISLHGRLVQETSKSGHHCRGSEGFDTICTAVCNRRDSSTACRLCRLEPFPPFLIIFPHHMSIPSQSITSNDIFNRPNSNQPSQLFTYLSVFHGDTTHPSYHLRLCSFKHQPDIN